MIRKNVGSISDETDINTGIFGTTLNTNGNIILTMDRLKTVGFDYSDYTYDLSPSTDGNCGWIIGGPLHEGQCRMWGNPIGEMMYESLRYFAGKGSPTPAVYLFRNAGHNTGPLQADLGIYKVRHYLSAI